MPRPGSWDTVVEFLAAHTGDPVGAAARVRAGEVVLDDGTVVAAGTPYRPGASAYLHRDLPAETPVPFEVPVLHRDDNLVVVDKPHFLATTPRGGHVRETVVLRLRRRLGLPELSPVHRLDRLTAGVLVLSARREVRGTYQQLFAQREVTKTYLALAPVRPGLALPVTVRSRLVKERGVLQAREVPGEANAETLVELLDQKDGVGRYRLTPRTGRTHQLRVHLASLGIPIIGDPLYPEVRTVAPDDFTDPLRLLALELSFTDPLSGEPRVFTSRRTLTPAGGPTGSAGQGEPAPLTP